MYFRSRNHHFLMISAIQLQKYNFFQMKIKRQFFVCYLCYKLFFIIEIRDCTSVVFAFVRVHSRLFSFHSSEPNAGASLPKCSHSEPECEHSEHISIFLTIFATFFETSDF